MCGITGIALGTRRRRHAELADIARLFTNLLLLNEERGRDATGFASVDRDGDHFLMKRGLPASEFITYATYYAMTGVKVWLREPDDTAYWCELGHDGHAGDAVTNKTTFLLGHCRFPTVGGTADPMNNQPIRRGTTIGTHNGTIWNHDQLARRHGIQRLCSVDSEVLVALYERSPSLTCFLDGLRDAYGDLAFAAVDTRNPRRLALMRGRKPLSAYYVERWRCIVWSSLNEHLVDSLAEFGPRSGDVKRIDIPKMSGLLVDVDALPDGKRFPIDFSAPRPHRLVWS